MKINRDEFYGVYVHIPFCLQKCAYCDFVSYPGLVSRAASYLENVFQEMEHYRGCRVDTVYIGGGTPTCLDVELLTFLLQNIKDCFRLTENCEITVECNPKTADGEYFKKLHKSGVNRLSIGVQSFHDKELALLGRLHNAEEARQCIKLAQENGFENLNLDLMFGLPNQTLSLFLESIEQALSLNPMHISAYGLIVEDGTPLAEKVQCGILRLPDEEVEREMYHEMRRMLAQESYCHYEISNFARNGFESRHNNKYWERSPYIGLGAAAHSQIGNLRFGNPAQLDEYARVAKNEPTEGRETEKLTKTDEMSEFIFLGLRKICGIQKEKFRFEFGMEIETLYGAQLDKFCKLGLLEQSEDRIWLSEAGMDVSNSIFCEFLLEEET